MQQKALRWYSWQHACSLFCRKVYNALLSDSMQISSAQLCKSASLLPMVSATLMSALGNQFTGFHTYGYPAHLTVCTSTADECANAAGALQTNYYECDKCRLRNWYLSKISTFKADDAQRRHAQLRLGSKTPLAVHTQIKKLFKEFRAKGGTVVASSAHSPQ
jgi:hypothetical protein